MNDIQFFTGDYTVLEKIGKEFFAVTISGGVIREELKKAYGDDKGVKYLKRLNLTSGKKIGPTWKIYDRYKKSNLPEKKKELEYYKSFKDEIFERRNFPDELSFIIESAVYFSGKRKIILLCYEKSNEFCHRFIIGEKMTELGFDIKEFGVEKEHSFYQGRVVYSQ